MITYFFWFTLLSVLVVIGAITYKTRFWKTGGTVGAMVFFGVWGMYHFKWEQAWVKNLGGTMTISVPKGLIHLGTTWKDENIWIENYDPKTNICYFSEYSKGHLLEGQLVIKHCNPALPSVNPEPAEEPVSSEEAAKDTAQ
ncbi:MAG: hypothetical protein RL497_459 [Pseudomonadota bacterium]|jgi:hypothetical protein